MGFMLAQPAETGQGLLTHLRNKGQFERTGFQAIRPGLRPGLDQPAVIEKTDPFTESAAP